MYVPIESLYICLRKLYMIFINLEQGDMLVDNNF
jgi:hypothetical protein